MPIRRRLRDMAFDAAVDFQGLTKSGMVLWASGAARRIGFEGRAASGRVVTALKALLRGSDSGQRSNRAASGAREFNTLFTNERIAPPPWAIHVVDRNNALLSALGITTVEPHFHFSYDAAERAVVTDFLERHGLGPRRFVVINPAGSWETKYWPAERYGSVAAGLMEARGLHSVMTWYGDSEKREAELAVQVSGGAALMAPPTSLGALACFLENAALYLGLETGPTHMAAGLGVPVVCLIGPTTPERNGPYPPTGAHEVVEIGPEALSCARCWLRSGCPAGLRCMMDIHPDRVIEAAQRVMRGKEPLDPSMDNSRQGSRQAKLGTGK